MRYAVIMAGGSGTRLWPMSTADQPKQLIPFIKGRSLLEIAADRLNGLVDRERQYICTGEDFREPIKRSLPRFGDERILGEPEGRDTLGAVGLPAAVIARNDPDAVVAVFTADHLIEPVDVFQQRVHEGYRIAEENPSTLVTFGIRPTYPATGYGYVQLGEALAGFDNACYAQAFKEKPDEQTARQYLERGRYLWNSGMFVWPAATLLDCIERYEPEVHDKLQKIAEAWDSDRRAQVLKETYPKLKKISVDYAVMEPAGRDEQVDVATVEMPVRWLDVGSWSAYAETLDEREGRNRVAADACLTMDCKDTLVVSDEPEHLIAALGVTDLVVVHTKKATLICHKDAAQRIKELHKEVGDQFGERYL